MTEKNTHKEIARLFGIIEINKFRLRDHPTGLASNYPPSIVRDIRNMRSRWRDEVKRCQDQIKELKTLSETNNPII